MRTQIPGNVAAAARAAMRILTLAALLCGAKPWAAFAADTNTLCAMTFNLRYASPRGANAWPDRRPVMSECITKYAPDVMGTQEGLYQQLKELASDLPDYEWIGLGRDGGSRGEFMAVFYRRARLEPKAFDHFWLSDTPEVMGSTHWGNTNRRMVTWVKFLDRRTGRMFFFVNTHLDHEIVAAREKGAALIRERVGKLEEGVPVILAGDFNSVASQEKAHGILVDGDFFHDTWDKAPVKRNDGYDTFHNFGGPRAGGRRIDWILTRGPWVTESVEIVLFSKNGQFPSDHHPYAAWVRLGE